MSVVVPCFNEQEVIEQTHSRLAIVMEGLDVDSEIVYVNDGSEDGTLDLLCSLWRRDGKSENEARIRVVNLSRNFGHQIAVTAGIDHTIGDAVVVIDADLQDPPEVIADFVAQWRAGYDVVYGRRTNRSGETWFKLWTAKVFYRVINVLSEIEIPMDTGDFRLMDRRVVDALRKMPERDRFMRGMISWVGFRQIGVPYQRDPRAAGDSKYPFSKMWRFAVDGIISFSLVPLKLASALGLAATAIAVFGMVCTLAVGLFTGIWSGWTLLFISSLFLGGVQLLCLGVIGEYIGRTYMEAKRRPLYLLGNEIAEEVKANKAATRSVR